MHFPKRKVFLVLMQRSSVASHPVNVYVESYAFALQQKFVVFLTAYFCLLSSSLLSVVIVVRVVVIVLWFQGE